MSKQARVLRGALGLAASLVASILVAQDPPTRVARVSYMAGTVSFKPGEIEEWTSATLNYPLTSGDRLWLAKESRAELQFGSTILQLGPETDFSIFWLDEQITLLSITQGSVFFRTRKLGPNDRRSRIRRKQISGAFLSEGCGRLRAA